MNEIQQLKFKIVAFSSSKGTYGVGSEDSGSFRICLHVVEVRDYPFLNATMLNFEN